MSCSPKMRLPTASVAADGPRCSTRSSFTRASSSSFSPERWVGRDSARCPKALHLHIVAVKRPANASTPSPGSWCWTRASALNGDHSSSWATTAWDVSPPDSGREGPRHDNGICSVARRADARVGVVSARGVLSLLRARAGHGCRPEPRAAGGPAMQNGTVVLTEARTGFRSVDRQPEPNGPERGSAGDLRRPPRGPGAEVARCGRCSPGRGPGFRSVVA